MLATAMWLLAGSFAVSAQRADIDDGDPQSSFAELDRYGKWIQHPEWGTVWSPDVEDDWRPYTVGRWVNTEEHGWYWDSEEPFGWAVYHYGRWVDDPEEGWIWIPGTEWAPAWVAWRYGEDAVGWAPLPPQSIWTPERGLLIDEEFYHGPRYASYWIFLAPRYLLSSGLHRFAHPAGRNASYFGRTRPATRYGFDNRRIFNHGIGVSEVERLTRSRVASVSLLSAARPNLGRNRAGAGAVYAFRPAIVPSTRWQSGRSGDWRRFEPSARPQSARQERNFVPPRNESFGSGQRPNQGGGLGRDSDRGSRDTGRDLRDNARDGAGRSERPSASVPSVMPPPERTRRDPDQDRSGRGDRVRDGRGVQESVRPREEPRNRPAPSVASPPPQPRIEAPRRDPNADRPRDGGGRSDGRNRDGGSARSSAPPAPQQRAQPAPPPPRPAAAQQRAQPAPPPPRPAVAQQPPAQKTPPPKKPDDAPAQQGQGGGGRRG